MDWNKIKERAIYAALAIFVIAILGLIIDGAHMSGAYQTELQAVKIKIDELDQRLGVIETMPRHTHWWIKGGDSYGRRNDREAKD